jgi:glycosyltransferase involved in cell wall biosynthesis
VKSVVLVAPHFPPSNLAAVHRARLWAGHLQEFGWRPIILAAHYRHYEERLDWDLARLLPPDLAVIRTAALPVRPVRLVGDIGIRALPFHYRALAGLARRHAIDFVHFTVPSFYSALLGRPLYRRHGVPYGIDYIDPWVHRWPGSERRFSKGWLSARLAERLEPWAVRDARLITGVAEEYFRPVLERHPHLRQQAVTAAMPYGASDGDVDAVRALGRRPYLFDPADGHVHVVYAGAMLPNGYAVLDRLLAGLVQARSRSAAAGRLRLHFIGTGRTPDDPEGYNIRPLIERWGLQDIVREHPARIPYVDVLVHLTHASGVVVLGSTERHYTPSKAFQALQSGRPLLALLHEESTAAPMLRSAAAGPVVTFAEGRLPGPEEVASALEQWLERPDSARSAGQVPEAYSARASARTLADALDRAILGVSRAR